MCSSLLRTASPVILAMWRVVGLYNGWLLEMLSSGKPSSQDTGSFMPESGGAGAEAAGEKVGHNNELYFQYEISSFVKED